jgi:Domain of unknown function (DUF3470)
MRGRECARRLWRCRSRLRCAPLLEGTHAYLAHALARDAELVREFLERDRFFGEPARLDWPNITVKKAPPPDSKDGRGSRTNSNTSYQIQARVIEADSPSVVVYGGADMPLTGPIPEGGTPFVPIAEHFIR